MVLGGSIPCQYGSTYSSFIGKGQAKIIHDPDEKIKALELLMKVQTGKDFEITSDMSSMVTVIAVTVDSFTAKARRV